jgi:hypothetical protein
MMTKRQKFVLTTLLLSLGLLAIQIANVGWRYQAIGVLAVLTYLFSAWSLREGLDGIEWLTVLILPSLYTAGVGLFYFLLPARWLTRLPVAMAYGLGMYALLLTENIFSVASIRTIQLFRAAQAVGFLLTLVTAFFLYDTILSFRLAFWVNSLFIFAVSLPIVLQGLWSVKLEKRIRDQDWPYIFGLSLIMAEAAGAISFWPVNVASGSLFLISVMYIVLGLSQQHLAHRLFARTIQEYLGVGLAVLAIILLTTHWGG